MNNPDDPEKPITSFRGTHIPQFEAKILQEIEKQLNKQFVHIEKIEKRPPQ